jgi:hypothetical protein
MVRQTKVLLLGTALVVATFGPDVTAQQPRFEFVASAGTIVIDSGDAGDVVVITGRSLGQRTVGTCTSSGAAFPLQMGVALDPGNQGRGPRTTEIQPLLDDALKPGTRIKNVAFVGDCEIGGQPYQKFTGEVE